MIKFIKNDLLIEEFQTMPLRCQLEPNSDELILPLPELKIVEGEMGREPEEKELHKEIEKIDQQIIIELQKVS